MQRILYLVAYDISHPRRLARALKTVRAYATGGQKSVHECWLLPGELATLKRDLEAVIDPVEDSVLFVRLDPRLKPRTLGIARPPVDRPSFLSAEGWLRSISTARARPRRRSAAGLSVSAASRRASAGAVERVVLRGDAALSTRVLAELCAAMSACCCFRRHSRRALGWPGPHDDAALRLLQYRRAIDAAACRVTAREIVAAKPPAEARLPGALLALWPDRRKPSAMRSTPSRGCGASPTAAKSSTATP
jgi:CRISPR-associated protein Cas2